MSLSEITFVDIPDELLYCENKEHKRYKVEFICTKKDCKQRLACSLCILNQHSTHFPWMRLIEDYTEVHRQRLELAERIKIRLEIENFVSKKDEYLNNFNDNMDNQVNNITNELNYFRNEINEYLDKLEKNIDDQCQSYNQHIIEYFHMLKTMIGVNAYDGGNDYDYDNHDENDDYHNKSIKASPMKDINSNTNKINIESIDQLLDYIELKLKSMENTSTTMNDNNESDNEDNNNYTYNKIEKIYTILYEMINSTVIIRYYDKNVQDLLKSIENLITFNMKIDNLSFYAHTHGLPISAFSYDNIICKTTYNTIHKTQINGVVFFHDETMMATYSDDGNIYIYSIKTGDLINTLIGHTAKVTSMIKLKDGSLVSSSLDKKIKIWNPFKATCEKTLTGHEGSVNILMEFPNQILISGSSDKKVNFWDLKDKESSSGQIIGFIKALKADNQGRIMSLALVSSDELAVSSEYNINIYNIDMNTLVKTLTGHEGLVKDIIIYDYKKHILLSCSDDNTIRMWNWYNGNQLNMIIIQSICNKLIMFNQDIIMSIHDDGYLRIWNLYSNQSIKNIQISKEPLINITKLSDGTLVTCGVDKLVKLWH